MIRARNEHISHRHAGQPAWGNSFNVEITVRWLVNDKFQPCKLKWNEKNDTKPNTGWEELYEKQVTGGGDVSPVFDEWRARVDPRGMPDPGSAERAKGKVLAHVGSLKGKSDTIPLVDSPYYTGATVGTQSNKAVRNLHGHVSVEPGCPDSPKCPAKNSSISASWAQRVSHERDIAQGAWFTHDKMPGEVDTYGWWYGTDTAGNRTTNDPKFAKEWARDVLAGIRKAFK